MNVKKYIGFLLFFISCNLHGFSQTNGTYEERVKNYIAQYSNWAMQEQMRVGIPASVTLAQGIYETGAGSSELATIANNHFGIKCKKAWTGETFAHTDDAPNECFRKYTSAYQSYQDHSNYLSSEKRYQLLFTYGVDDYKAWCRGLKQCGYATNPKYAQLIINLIEKYNLDRFTDSATILYATPALENPKAHGPFASVNEYQFINAIDTPETEVTQEPDVIDNLLNFEGVTKVNNLNAFVARKGETLLEYAIKYNIRYQKLLDINDLSDGPLPFSMYIYLEKKHLKGDHAYYIVKEQETLLQIAQTEGIQLKQLRILNKLEENEEVVPGEKLNLKIATAKKPKTYLKIDGSTDANDPIANNIDNYKEDGFLEKSKLNFEIKKSIVFKDSLNTLTDSSALIAQQADSSLTPMDTVKKLSIAEQRQLAIKERLEQAKLKQEQIRQNALKLAEERAAQRALVMEAARAKRDSIMRVNQEKLALRKKQYSQDSLFKSKYYKDSIASAKKDSSKLIVADTLIAETPILVQKEKKKKEKPQVLSKKDLKIKEFTARNIDTLEGIQTRNAIDIPKENTTTGTNTITVNTINIPKNPIAIQQVAQDEFDELKFELDKVVYAYVESEETSKPNETKEINEQQNAVDIPKGNSKQPVYYTVKNGDTLFSIAKKFKVSVKQLNSWNKLDFTEVKTGTKLIVQP